MNIEKSRLADDAAGNADWRRFGPYLSERQWGTVREDYSAGGLAWEYLTHDHARSTAFRWGEEGIGGISDDEQLLCFSLGLWNGNDSIIKERLFGLTNGEGNHAEDCKELYYYLDNTPTHSYMKMLYKYPQEAYPYEQLIAENGRRGMGDREYEIMDTGIFNQNRYFDVFMEYAKADPGDILIKISIHNRGSEAARLVALPQLWYRNTWSWGYDDYRPQILSNGSQSLKIDHRDFPNYQLHFDGSAKALFCENETNTLRRYGRPTPGFFKDGINDCVVDGNTQAVNRGGKGTKAALQYDLTIDGGAFTTLRLRLCPANGKQKKVFDDFDAIMEKSVREAEEFYAEVQQELKDPDLKRVQRQAFAGMLWSKQLYYFDVAKWLNGDPAQPTPPAERKHGRNNDWMHLNNKDIISMPDKWEYPWYAAWDLAFHVLPLVTIDAEFAKKQLLIFTKEWYMHPNGQIPSYEWSFADVNPPVHGWATWRVYKIDQKLNNGKGDRKFLEEVFHKLLLNFTWWVNKKDNNGNNIFQGGFLGMDNIGVFDRNAHLPSGGYIEQSDGTSWMAMFTLNMLRMSLELAKENHVYENLASKFFEHFLYIAAAIASLEDEGINLWDEEDEFFYDVLHAADDQRIRMKVRSMVGLIPLFAVEVLDNELYDELPGFSKRLNWFLDNRPDLASLVSRWTTKGRGEHHLLSLLRGHRMKCLLRRMLDTQEFLSDFGIRALSKVHEEHPYKLSLFGDEFSVKYVPGESDSDMFGGNSNWRGPIWFPVNYLIIESLQKFHHYYGDDFKVEHPTGSGNMLTLNEIANELAGRLTKIFLRDENGRRPVFGSDEKQQTDPYFKDYVLFYEYFHGDNGRGLGASHQTGWTGLVAKLIVPRTVNGKKSSLKLDK